MDDRADSGGQLIEDCKQVTSASFPKRRKTRVRTAGGGRSVNERDSGDEGEEDSLVEEHLENMEDTACLKGS